MSSSDGPKRIFRILLAKSMDGQLTVEETRQFNELLDTYPDLESYYFKCVHLHIALGQIPIGQKDSLTEQPAASEIVLDSNVSIRGIDLGEFNLDIEGESDGSGLTQAMLELLEMERTSPAVDIPKEQPRQELIQKVERDFKFFPGKGNKALTRAYLALAACIMIFVGYVYFFVPDPVERPIVARLDDSIDAVWDNKLQVPNEFGNMVQSRYRLEKGYANIIFNDGASVTVEAPAEMSLNSAGDMELFSGKIYAAVPPEAKGFSVKACGSKIVDLGTEFGVEVDRSDNIQLHVTKGRTLLFAGLFSGKKEEIKVDAGAARKVYNDGFVKNIPAESRRFARRIDSKANLVFRDNKLNLADVVGGGNGFGTGTLEKGIDMVAARFQLFRGENLRPVNTKDFSYKRFVEHPYIDGVCIPNSGAGPVKITSKGHIFESCPVSEGVIWSGVFNGAFHLSQVRGIPKTQSSLDGKIYGTVSNPAIYMTPNQAVTFDLDAIRKDLKGVSITGFSSKAGLSETLLDYPEQQVSPKTSFYVLVDGVARFSKIDQQATDDVLDIRVDIRPNDRFLTIMTLQGTDGRTDFECSLFAEPSLNLE